MRRVRQAGVPFILVTVFVDMLGIGIVIPILPALVGTLTPNRGAQSYWYGALLASYGLAQFLGAPLLGALSDRLGRRPVLLVAIFGLGLNFLITGLSPFLWLFLAGRLLGGATGASYSVAGAYLADVTPAEQRSKSFGLMGAALGLGFICGPMVGGWLGSYNLRLPYFVAAGLSLLNWLNGYFVLPESLPQNLRTPFSLARANPFSGLAGLARLKDVSGLVIVYALITLAQFIVQATWVLYTTFRFGWGPRENGISLFLVGVAATVAQGWLLGVLLQHIGERRTVLLGLCSATLASLLYGLANTGWMMYAIILANVLAFVTGPALQGIISRSVDPREQGISLGSLNAVSSICGVVAPLVAMPVLASVSQLPRADWRVGATFFACAILQAAALARWQQQKGESL